MLFIYRKILMIHICEKEQSGKTRSKHYISLNWKEVRFAFWKKHKRTTLLTEIIEYIYKFIKWHWELHPSLQFGPLKILPFLALARVLLFHRSLECIRMHRSEETFSSYYSSSSRRQSYSAKTLKKRWVICMFNRKIAVKNRSISCFLGQSKTFWDSHYSFVLYLGIWGFTFVLNSFSLLLKDAEGNDFFPAVLGFILPVAYSYQPNLTVIAVGPNRSLGISGISLLFSLLQGLAESRIFAVIEVRSGAKQWYFKVPRTELKLSSSMLGMNCFKLPSRKYWLYLYCLWYPWVHDANSPSFSLAWEKDQTQMHTEL